MGKLHHLYPFEAKVSQRGANANYQNHEKLAVLAGLLHQ